MTNFTFAHIQDLYSSANNLDVGGAGPAPMSRALHVKTMAAIAIAESSGNPNVVNSSGHYGLWQISKDHALDPGWPFGAASSAWLDPATNARMAEWVYKKQGYTAWTTYNNGAYSKVNQGGPGDQLASGTNNLVNQSGLAAIGQFFSDLGNPQTWLRIAYGVAGIGLVIFGISAVASNTKAGKVIASTTGKAALL